VIAVPGGPEVAACDRGRGLIFGQTPTTTLSFF
jgi:hypothetical protein